MALIKCEECGQMVSDKAGTCPKCGCPIEAKVICSECGQVIPSREVRCPNCGCPVESSATEKAVTHIQKPQKMSKATYYIIGIVGYIVLSTLACAVLRTTYSQYKYIADKILEESLCCSVVASVLIFLLSKKRSIKALLIILLVFVLLSLTCSSLFEELGYGTAIIQFLVHMSLIILAISRR